MLGKSKKLQPKLFYYKVSLEQRVPEDHPLRKIKQVVDFSFVREQVSELYGSSGNVSVDPAVVLKLIFLLFFENISSERQLARQLPLRMDWLWFCGYDLDEQTPNHSVLSKARARWGKDIFVSFFEKILSQCVEAGLVDGEIIHIDSSMIDANAGKKNLKPQLKVISEKLYDDIDRQASQVETENDRQIKIEDAQSPEKPLVKKNSKTDPDARLSSKYGKTTFGYKDHRTVDDKHGIITATITTAANINDDKLLKEVVELHESNTSTRTRISVADRAYGTMDNYKYLYERDTLACIGHQRHGNKQDRMFGHENFIYNEVDDCFVCPAGEILKCYDHVKAHKSCEGNYSYRYKAQRKVCEQCRYFSKCVNSKDKGRQITRNINAMYVEWAENCMSKSESRYYKGRRWHIAEGSFADAANNHGFKRARWRGIDNVVIQNHMIAATQNLRKLVSNIGRKVSNKLSDRAFTAIEAVLEGILLTIRGFLSVKIVSQQILSIKRTKMDKF